MRRISALVVLVVLFTAWGLPAQACTGRLPLASYDIESDVVQDPEYPVMCDGSNFFDCGLVHVEASFSGLEGRSRPGATDSPYVLNAGGTVQVDRTYGCRNARGKRLRVYDSVVSENLTMNTRRGVPLQIPDGDTLTVDVYAFLFDAQPGGCPAGTQPMMYRLVARQVRVELESRWASIPSATYRLRGRGVWTGAVPTPALAA